MLRTLRLIAVGSLLLPSYCCVTGCAAVKPGSSCVYGEAITVGPSTATANHSSSSPGNQVMFDTFASETGAGTGCVIPALAMKVYAHWTNPDPLDITISNAQDSTNGLATCNSTTSGPVTLTETATMGSTTQSGSVQLTCQ
jgi:hypothetical protein